MTFPDKLRAKLGWLDTGSIVSVITESTREVKIIPYTKLLQKSIDWKKLLLQIERVRSYKGKRGNLSQFIVQDRESH